MSYRDAGEFSGAEWALGYAVGAARCDWNRNRGHRDTFGHYDVAGGDRLASHVVGALGELAVAERWALEWRPLWLKLDKTRPDVGNLHVRATARADGCLLLHDDDPDDGPFVCVIVEGRRWRIVGWRFARDGKHWNRRRPSPNGLPQSFFLPQPELLPVWACPARELDDEEVEAWARREFGRLERPCAPA